MRRCSQWITVCLISRVRPLIYNPARADPATIAGVGLGQKSFSSLTRIESRREQEKANLRPSVTRGVAA
jgi:hypothetical protein